MRRRERERVWGFCFNEKTIKCENLLSAFIAASQLNVSPCMDVISIFLFLSFFLIHKFVCILN